jgi:hypothetical protein
VGVGIQQHGIPSKGQVLRPERWIRSCFERDGLASYLVSFTLLLLLFLSSRSEMTLHIFSLHEDDLPAGCSHMKFQKKKTPRRGKLSAEQLVALKKEREVTKKVADAARFITAHLGASR